jgi:hypothetical protein
MFDVDVLLQLWSPQVPGPSSPPGYSLDRWPATAIPSFSRYRHNTVTGPPSSQVIQKARRPDIDASPKVIQVCLNLVVPQVKAQYPIKSKPLRRQGTCLLKLCAVILSLQVCINTSLGSLGLENKVVSQPKASEAVYAYYFFQPLPIGC